MDNTNWRNGQAPMILPPADAGEQSSLPGSGIAPSVESDDWRALLPPDSRLRIVNKIMDTLKKHLPFSGQEGLQELKKIAVRFEEKIYSAATSQSDYLRKISLKMLTMEKKSQSPTGNSLQANAANASRDPSDLASHSMQAQMQNQGLTIPIVGGQSQGRQQLLSQNIQNDFPTAGMQNSATLTATLPSVSNLTQASIGNAVSQSNLQSMQNNPAQNPVGNSIGQGMPSNVLANSQRQMQGTPQQVVQQQQQQQQNPQHLYQQQLQQQFIKQKLQSGAIAQPMVQSHVQNQHQQQPPVQNQPQSEISQTHENKITSHMQQMDPQSSMAARPQNNLSTLQQNILSSTPSISNAHQNMIQSLQPASNTELGQNGSLNFVRQVPVHSLQQNSLGSPKTLNLGSLSSQTGANTLQLNLNSLPTDSSMLQNQHLRPQEQHMLHSQQLKQIHQRQMQHQFLQRQQQQLPAQLPAYSFSPLHHMTDFGDLKMRHEQAVESGVYQQHPSTNQQVPYSQQQVKPGTPFSSTQVPQASSSQFPQQPSPLIDQQNPASSTKTATLLHSVNSPFTVPSPSTLLAPSAMPGDSEKVNSSISSLPNSIIVHLQINNAAGSTKYLAFGTPGVSASPLLAEFTSLDGAHGNTSMAISGRPNTAEQPTDQLIKVVSLVLFFTSLIAIYFWLNPQCSRI